MSTTSTTAKREKTARKGMEVIETATGLTFKIADRWLDHEDCVQIMLERDYIDEHGDKQFQQVFIERGRDLARFTAKDGSPLTYFSTTK